MSPVHDDPRYAELLEREARHWGGVAADPDNPQLWDDPVLWDAALGAAWRRLIDRAVASGGPVLELGCGEGGLALELAGRGVEVLGLDLSPERIARAREAAARAGLAARARFEIADLNTAPMPAGPWRCVVAHDALHHVLALEALLDRVRDALPAGGLLVVSDYRGAGAFEKLATAAAIGVLPTRLSYARKWAMRKRLAPALASERAKRDALDRGEGAVLHDASPFEGISQASIFTSIAARFDVVESFTFCPYWYQAVPKLRLPRNVQRAAIRIAARLDTTLHRHGWTKGSYQFIAALRR